MDTRREAESLVGALIELPRVKNQNPEEKRDRAHQMYLLHMQHGWPLRKVGSVFAMSAQRVSQLLETYDLPTRPHGGAARRIVIS